MHKKRPGDPPSGSRQAARRRAWRTIRFIWIAAGIGFTVWLYQSFNADGVAASLMQSDARVIVTETDAVISFKPLAPHAHGLLFFHGGGVEPIAYAPLIRTVAEAGYTAVIVKLPYRFAPLASHRQQALDRARQAMASMPEISGWVLAGHSKGGLLASRLALDPALPVKGLILIGTSHPRDFTLSQITFPVRKIYASNDGLASPDTIEATRHNLPPHTEWIEISGGNHAQFGHYGPQLMDGAATISREEQQRQTLEILLAALQDL